MLLAVFDVRRATQDIDMAARALEADPAEIAAWLHDVVAVDLDDSVRFDLSELRTEPIRVGDSYPALHVHAAAYVATAKVALKIDVNFGDPIVPEPQAVNYPSLLVKPFPILGYPAHRCPRREDRKDGPPGRSQHTRDRDFADVALLSRLHPVDGDELLSSLQATARHRDTVLAPLTEAHGSLVENRERAWGPIRRRLSLEEELSADFADVVAEVVRFAEPVLTGEVAAGPGNPSPAAGPERARSPSRTPSGVAVSLVIAAGGG